MSGSARTTLCRVRFLSTLLSTLVLCVVAFCTISGGINWGVDFAGGVNIEIESKCSIHDLRNRVGQLISSVQESGEGRFLLKASSADNLQSIKAALGHSVVYRKVDVVGPKLGSELLRTFAYAIVIALCCMWVYIALVFGGMCANIGILGLIHDLMCIVGVYSVFGLEFDEFAIVGMLSTIGYSINDTIILFDAIKERVNAGEEFSDLVAWQSILDTLRRTILTSVTTAASVIVFCFSGGVLFRFALPMLVGVVVGTYSSICLVVPYLSLVGGMVASTLTDDQNSGHD